MAMLAPTAERAVRDFASSAGLSASPAADGSFSFRFGTGDLLTFTPGRDAGQMMMSLAFALPGRGDRDLERVLALAGHDPVDDRLIHVGRGRDGTYVIATAVDAAGADLPTLDRVLATLRRLRMAA